jgi:sugar lactone lactonase YvrE
MKSKFVSLLLVFFMLKAGGQTARVEFEAPAMYPEGVAFDAASGNYYVSSVRTSTIGKVDKQGKYSVVYADTALKSSFGMKIDPIRKRLWFCAGDPSYSQYRDSATWKKMIRLVGLDLQSGEKVADIDLSALYSGPHFANDLALDDKGNIYITDSYSPVIYKVDADGKASVFSQSNWFAAVGTGLNGIVYHPSGYLLVAHNANGQLLKVDIREPQRIGKVKINQFFPGADGLLLDDNKELVLIQNKGVNKIFRLVSADNWVTAKVTAATQAKDRFDFPSTATFNNKQVWVMNAKLHELSDSTKTFSRKFSIQQAVFVPVK